ncbi:hypothetical protein HMPREF9123_0533 [Neisseria bacilliformis ATCC BAA-1200]|uniref:Uncharacterized protein n=1 Tax=Neisseria bacilliformis ATCC BAA-1200 TaxID=888742 RepID=F2BA04_9NEIS|nr:hypothetical protein HMPREF9123_0533 [Neisseria bacilliformis ATCC BAA-1200]
MGRRPQKHQICHQISRNRRKGRLKVARSDGLCMNPVPLPQQYFSHTRRALFRRPPL